MGPIATKTSGIPTAATARLITLFKHRNQNKVHRKHFSKEQMQMDFPDILPTLASDNTLGE